MTSTPGQRLVFDFTYFGLCVLSGCKYALVCIDHHAGRVWGETFVTKEQADVAMWLFKFLLDLGLTPDMLHCDNGGGVYQRLHGRCVPAF